MIPKKRKTSSFSAGAWHAQLNLELSGLHVKIRDLKIVRDASGKLSDADSRKLEELESEYETCLRHRDAAIALSNNLRSHEPD